MKEYIVLGIVFCLFLPIFIGEENQEEFKYTVNAFETGDRDVTIKGGVKHYTFYTTQPSDYKICFRFHPEKTYNIKVIERYDILGGYTHSSKGTWYRVENGIWAMDSWDLNNGFLAKKYYLIEIYDEKRNPLDFFYIKIKDRKGVDYKIEIEGNYLLVTTKNIDCPLHIIIKAKDGKKIKKELDSKEILLPYSVLDSDYKIVLTSNPDNPICAKYYETFDIYNGKVPFPQEHPHITAIFWVLVLCVVFFLMLFVLF